jgi:hypothetical protein
MYLTALEEAEIIPGKDSDTRITPLALTNGNGRYMTVTPERANGHLRPLGNVRYKYNI